MNLQRGQGRNQTWITQPSLNVSTVCWVKPSLSSTRTRTRRTSSISTRVFDDGSFLESESNSVAKEIRVVVANIDQFGPTTNKFLGSPAANEIAGFMFSEMHVKEQGFALQGFHSSVSAATQSELSQSGSCGGTATLFRSHLPISHPFDSIQPHPCDVCLSLPYLRHGHRRDEPSETLRDRFVCHECRYSLRHGGGLECVAVRVVGIRLACPYQGRDFAPV